MKFSFDEHLVFAFLARHSFIRGFAFIDILSDNRYDYRCDITCPLIVRMVYLDSLSIQLVPCWVECRMWSGVGGYIRGNRCNPGRTLCTMTDRDGVASVTLKN